jgi:hypothetical protein
MRNIMAGFGALGLLTIGTGTAATAHTLSVSPVVMQSSIVQRVDSDDCGPRCQEHRREVREEERQRSAQHQRWAGDHRREESRYSPAPEYGYQHRD